MKLRYITGIFCFLAAFGLSVFLVLLSPYNIRSTQAPCEKTQTIAVNSEPELQASIRQFLEADRQNGHELSANLVRFRANKNELDADMQATSNLVRKMKAVKCTNLPADFCAAWDEHVAAWHKENLLLETAVVKNANRNADDSKVPGEISRTYYRMLEIAEKYGVYFTY